MKRNTGWLGAAAFPARALGSNLHRKGREILHRDQTGSLSCRPATTGVDGEEEYRTETDRFWGRDRTDYEVSHPTWKPSCFGKPDEMGQTVIHMDTSWDTFRKGTDRNLAADLAEVAVLESPSSV